MSRTTFRRIARLEARQPEHFAPWHQIILEPSEDETARVAPLVATGTAKETDNFMLVRIVDPPAREAA